jgi:hypothetical protein
MVGQNLLVGKPGDTVASTHQGMQVYDQSAAVFRSIGNRQRVCQEFQSVPGPDSSVDVHRVLQSPKCFNQLQSVARSIEWLEKPSADEVNGVGTKSRTCGLL